MESIYGIWNQFMESSRYTTSNIPCFPRFDLDPNRVLDLILETWQNYPDKNEFFLDLVHLFPKQDDTLANMLGFNFAFYEVKQGRKKYRKGVILNLYSLFIQQIETSSVHFVRLQLNQKNTLPLSE